MLYIVYNERDMKKRKKNDWTVIMINIDRSESQETRKEKKNDSCKWLYERLLIIQQKERGKS